MSRSRFFAFIFGFLAWTFFLSSTASAQDRVLPPTIDAKAAGATAIKDYDENRNGKLDAKEIEAAPAIKCAIRQIDKDNDGTITAEEIEGRIVEWQESRLGLMSLMCTVMLDGKPLEGATVFFLPEKFLGANVRPGSGVTNEQGMAVISLMPVDRPINAKDIAGMAPGFYKIHITKGKEVPKKYNDETVLGQEIAIDAEGLAEGLTFRLETKK